MRLHHAATLLLVLLAGCDRESPLSEYVGKHCSVQFRRDALGAEAGSPIDPQTDTWNGVNVAIRGTIKKATADWLVLAHDETSWVQVIPMQSVLLVKVYTVESAPESSRPYDTQVPPPAQVKPYPSPEDKPVKPELLPPAVIEEP